VLTPCRDAQPEEVEQDFYVRLAYKELAEEEERLRNPGKWRDLEQFEVNQLFMRYARMQSSVLALL
jgi:hypothetical protein